MSGEKGGLFNRLPNTCELIIEKKKNLSARMEPPKIYLALEEIIRANGCIEAVFKSNISGQNNCYYVLNLFPSSCHPLTVS